MKTIVRELKWRTAYFLTYCEAVFLRIDAWLYERQGNHILAADADCRVYECERRLQDLKMFKWL